MEKLVLRPKELTVQPEAPDAQRTFGYWLRTVEDFIDSLTEFRKDGDPEINKKRIIVSCSCNSDCRISFLIARTVESRFGRGKTLSSFLYCGSRAAQ